MAYTWEKDSEDINRAFAKFSADKAVLIGVYCMLNSTNMSIKVRLNRGLPFDTSVRTAAAVDPRKSVLDTISPTSPIFT